LGGYWGKQGPELLNHRSTLYGEEQQSPIFQGAADFDLELIEHQTLDRQIQELIYRTALHVPGDSSR
jgi:hypothetical protein